MLDEEKQLSRILFRDKAVLAKGQDFENIFSNVMSKKYEDFQPVKPQGQFGDRKNDGWVKSKGIYYQVYAPEDITNSVNTAVQKLQKDFSGLHQYWNEISQIKQFYFVINDRYYGTFPTIEATLSQLAKEYKEIKFDVYLLKNLENAVLSLDRSDILDITGFLPNLHDISDIDIGILTEVIGYLMPNLKPYTPGNIAIKPDYMEKIKFNKLGSYSGGLLTSAYYQIGVLEEYFRANGDYAESRITEKMIEFYEEAKEKFKVYSEADNIFHHILNRCSPRIDKRVQDAVLVVMSKYFEACDIFEEPQ